jgi:threonine aldolase
MLKYRFFNDYSEGAHPRLLELLAATNLDQEDGYGNDTLCQQAAALLLQQVENPRAAVHFISGGTQANLIALAAMLRPFESVIAATSAHINVHETGAVEATGHKINTVLTTDGKLSPAQVQEVVDRHTDEHMVKPRAVFITNSTEVGTIYLKSELEALAQVCQKNGLYLYLDGARLGSALTCRTSDLTLPDLGRLVDMFYIGGTKNGALLGEAMVINNPALQTDFRFYLKQRGALLAKGRILGSQFLGLFQDGLYFELARHANKMAEKMAVGIRKLGFEFLYPPATNQIFPIFPDALIAELQQMYGFYIWTKLEGGYSAIRLVTCWSTAEKWVDECLSDIAFLRQPVS